MNSVRSPRNTMFTLFSVSFSIIFINSSCHLGTVAGLFTQTQQATILFENPSFQPGSVMLLSNLRITPGTCLLGRRADWF